MNNIKLEELEAAVKAAVLAHEVAALRLQALAALVAELKAESAAAELEKHWSNPT